MKPLKEKIEEEIKMNGVYTVTFSLPTFPFRHIRGHENLNGGHGYIEVSKRNGKFLLSLYNREKEGKFDLHDNYYDFIFDEENEMFSEFDQCVEGIEKYSGRKTFTGSLPLGWGYDTDNPETNEGYEKLIEIIEALGAEIFE